MYNIESLKEINKCYAGVVNQSLVDKINNLISVIESANGDPQNGDVVTYTNSYGKTFQNARLDGHTYSEYENGICENGSVHIGLSNNKLYTSISGGSFGTVNPANLTRKGNTKANFWAWGAYSGASMGIYFSANVQQWEYTELRNWSEVCFEMYHNEGKPTKEALLKLSENKPQKLETFTRLIQSTFDGDRVFTISFMDDTHFFAELFDRYSIIYYIGCGWSITDNKTKEDICNMY